MIALTGRTVTRAGRGRPGAEAEAGAPIVGEGRDVSGAEVQITVGIRTEAGAGAGARCRIGGEIVTRRLLLERAGESSEMFNSMLSNL